MTKTKFLALIASVVLVLTMATAAFAQGISPPNKFGGMVMIGDDVAADGTMIVAMIGEDKVADAMVMDGNYVLQIEQGDESREGMMVTFMVGDMDADETVTWMAFPGAGEARPPRNDGHGAGAHRHAHGAGPQRPERLPRATRATPALTARTAPTVATASTGAPGPKAMTEPTGPTEPMAATAQTATTALTALTVTTAPTVPTAPTGPTEPRARPEPQAGSVPQAHRAQPEPLAPAAAESWP